MDNWRKAMAVAAGVMLGAVAGFIVRPLVDGMVLRALEDTSDYDEEYENERRNW